MKRSRALRNTNDSNGTTVPVDSVSAVDVTVLTVLTVGVVKGVDVAVLIVETEAVVPVVVNGELAVV